MQRNHSHSRAPRKQAAAVTMETFHAKVPPHSTEAELSVLGGLMLENRAIDRVADILKPEDFYIEAHRIIYEAIESLAYRNQPADILTVGEYLKSRGLLDAIGGFEYLSQVQDAVPSTAYIDAYARLIREKASVRACIRASMEVLAKAYGDYGDVEEFLDEAEKKMFDATHRRTLGTVVKIKDAVMDTFTIIDKLGAKRTSVTGVPTGYKRLDAVTAGLQNSDLVIIAGRPGMGKTALALNIAVNAYKHKQVPSVIFSLEMSIHQLMIRLLSSEAEVNATKLRVPRRLTTEDTLRLSSAASTLGKMNLFLDDSPELTVLEIRSRARRLKDEHDIGLVIIDYLQILRPAFPSRNDSREREVAEMSRSLKALAKELNIPVVALSQLNRRPDMRGENRRPQLADLRESGAIEQDADLILFLYREAAYSDMAQHAESTKAEIIVGKNRNGPTTIIPVEFIKEYTRFNDPEGEDYNLSGETFLDGIDFED